MIDHRAEYELAERAAETLRAEGLGGARIVLQTGSGIRVPDLTDRRTLSWTEIDGFPRATAPGHRGAVHFGRCRGVPLLVLDGRLHAYEGHEPAHVVRPIRVAKLLGAEIAILTNACGGIREDLRAKEVVLIRDHLNFLGFDPLAGLHDPRFGDRFAVVAGRAHDEGLARVAIDAAAGFGETLRTGVYAAVHGPSFESPAQVRFLRTAGADVVGMSTVPEILAATQMGMRTLVLSLVANPAGEVAQGATAEDEVLLVARRAATPFVRLLEEIVARIGDGAAG